MGEHRRIDRELMDHLCKVARLALAEEEKERFTRQLKAVLDAFRMLDEVDVDGVEPRYHPLEMENIWREDRRGRWEWDPVSNSRHREDGYFKGPRIT